MFLFLYHNFFGEIYVNLMTKLLGVSKMHANNKMTVPKELREHLKIHDGNYVKFILEGEKGVMKKLQA